MAEGRVTEEAIKAGLDVTVDQWLKLKSIVNCLATSRKIYDTLQAQLDLAKNADAVDFQHVSVLTARMERRLDTHAELMALLHQNFSELATHLERAGS